MNEEQHWKLVAAYLASCHAATLESLPKRAAKSERKRLAEICRKAAAYLRGTDSPRRYGIQSADESIASDIARCDNAATTHDVSPNEKGERLPGNGGGSQKQESNDQ